MYELRDYQKDGVDNALEVLRAKKSKAIIVQPTGAGKSLIIAKAVKELDRPVVILQPSKELLVQNYKKFIDFGGKASIYCASLKEKTIKNQSYTTIGSKDKKCEEVSKVTFATIGSIKKEIAKLKKLGVKHIIVDEVHLGSKAGSQMRDFIKKLGATNVLGLTATPIYLEGGMNGSRLIMINRMFATIFKKIQQVTQINELVEKKFWTPLNYKIIKNDESALKLNSNGSDYTEHSQKEYYKSNNLKEQIAEEVKNLKKEGRKRILIFVPSIDEAEQLYGIIPNSAVVHSKMSREERDFMVESFTNGDIPVAINVNVLATGYDNPEIDVIITARPTSSVAMSYQQLGRGVRLHKDKKDCKIVDFSGNVQRFGRIEELVFKEIENYGWGMFNGKDELLSDYPIQTVVKPTIKSLIEKHKKVEQPKGDDASFYFGKYKGKKVSDVVSTEEGKSYCIWITNQKDFNWWGENGKKLKTCIYRELGLPLPQTTTPPPPKYDKSKDFSIRNFNPTVTLDNIQDIF
jgi:DNA repair protein RadD